MVYEDLGRVRRLFRFWELLVCFFSGSFFTNISLDRSDSF